MKPKAPADGVVLKVPSVFASKIPEGEERVHLIEEVKVRGIRHHPHCQVKGQIIATSHDRFPPKGSVWEGKWDPLFQGYLGW